MSGLALMPASAEVLSLALDPLGDGFYRVQVDLNPAQVQAGLRTLAWLDFSSTALGRSSVAELHLSGLVGLRLGGELLANATRGDGQVFVIEEEPLLDTEGFSGSTLRLVAYAKPGSTLRLQRITQLDGAHGWIDVQTISLPGTFQPLDWTADQAPVTFFRLVR